VKIQKNPGKSRNPEEIQKNPEKSRNPEAGKKPEKLAKSGIFPGNPEDLATLVLTKGSGWAGLFYSCCSHHRLIRSSDRNVLEF